MSISIQDRSDVDESTNLRTVTMPTQANLVDQNSLPQSWKLIDAFRDSNDTRRGKKWQQIIDPSVIMIYNCIHLEFEQYLAKMCLVHAANKLQVCIVNEP